MKCTHTNVICDKKKRPSNSRTHEMRYLITFKITKKSIQSPYGGCITSLAQVWKSIISLYFKENFLYKNSENFQFRKVATF